MKSGGAQLNLHAFLAPFVFAFCTAAAAHACPAPELQAKASESALARNLSMAESQHEIVLILLKKKDFAQAFTEADKIFQMEWPANEESRLLKEILGLSGQFLKYEQGPLGLQLLEKNLKIFKVHQHQAAIWKEMGYLHKTAGNDDRALECFKKAQQLEKSSPE
jgi:tetratricopeptide (TPR) repeat protein